MARHGFGGWSHGIFRLPWAIRISGFGWFLTAPIAGVAIALLVIYSSWSLLKEMLGVLIEDAPGHIDGHEVREALLTVHGVDSVQDLHVGTITSGMVAASVHFMGGEGEGATARRMLGDAKAVLHDRFGIDHATIQVDVIGDDACHRACDPPEETCRCI